MLAVEGPEGPVTVGEKGGTAIASGCDNRKMH